ncbi:MAG: hypothetical protein NTX45_11975 [Proteobacteria bacterium]|nr:hypothetical protein [Pseudomonadota bacterium]
MNNIRDRAKQFYNQLDFDKPIGFGGVELFKGSLPEKYYVTSIHGLGDRDPVQELADQIDFADSAGAYLFTGNRGTGKTTELLRLGRILQSNGCEVFYADMTDYLNMSQSIEVSDFLISLMGAFSEKVAERFGDDPGKPGFFERVWNFLKTTEVSFPEIKLPAGPVEFKVALHENPTFRQALQKGVRGYVEQLFKQAREFALETVNRIRSKRGDENLKVVFIVDSVERLRGVGDNDDVREVFKSAETLFSAHADKLRFTGLSVVYTVPPYLQALAGALGASYAGGRIYALPSVHIYQGKPKDGEPAIPYKDGLDKLVSIIDKRYPQWRDFFKEEQLSRLAQNSGGDLRDFFRMLRLAVTRAHRVDTLPFADTVISDAEDAVRGDMLPIAKDDAQWLARVSKSHKAELDSLGDLTDFARLQQGKYLLHYRNGEDWYDVHPLLRKEVQASGH